jgi:hypothetical protein
MKQGMGWVVVVACVVVMGGRLFADDKQYIGEIDSLLDGIASDLDRVSGDSGTGYVDSAIRKADEIKDKTRRVTGSDARARRYAENFPGYVDRFKESAGYLRQLKEQQRSLDGFPRQCEDKQKELADKIRRFTDANNPDGLEAIPRLGREYGKPVREAIDQADRKKRELESWRDRAKNFSEGDQWSTPRDKLRGAAEATYDHWKRNWEQSKRDCSDLVKEDRNPIVEAGIRLLADGEKIRQELYRELDKQLDEAQRAVEDLERDSNESRIDGALRAADGLQSYIDKLNNAKGDDRKAREIASNWPRYISAFREAMRYLRTLKQAQFIVDKAPAVCKEAEERLNEVIRKIVDPRAYDDRDQITLVARNLGKSIAEKLQAASQQDSVMRSARDAAKGFSISEGKWRDVAGKLARSADAIYKYWDDARGAAHTACDELAKGDQHKKVLSAMRILEGSHTTTETALGRIEADHRRWYEQIRELREWYKQDTRNVRDMFCALDESVGDTADGDAYAAQLGQIADRMRNRIAPRWNELMAESTRVLGVLRDLRKAPEEKVRSKADLLSLKLERTVNGLVNLMNNELNGANDPEVRMQIEVGKTEHKRIQADSSKCSVSEITIPGAGLRMDCVRVSSGTCYIVEIKPNNANAAGKGEEKLKAYISAMTSYYSSNRDHVKEKFTDKLEIFQQCIANGTIQLRSELRRYELCPADGRLFQDFVVLE